VSFARCSTDLSLSGTAAFLAGFTPSKTAGVTSVDAGHEQEADLIDAIGLEKSSVDVVAFPTNYRNLPITYTTRMG
jgi:hypothetical protein